MIKLYESKDFEILLRAPEVVAKYGEFCLNCVAKIETASGNTILGVSYTTSLMSIPSHVIAMAINAEIFDGNLTSLDGLVEKMSSDEQLMKLAGTFMPATQQQMQEAIGGMNGNFDNDSGPFDPSAAPYLDDLGTTESQEDSTEIWI